MERKVVITGMGIWSCLGTTLDEVRDSLYSGKSGIIFSQERKDAGFRSPLCACIPHPDLKPFIPRNQRQFMPEEAQYAYMATRAALESARLDADYIAGHEVGIIYGNDSVAEATMHALDKFRDYKDTAACGSGAIFQSMNSTVTMNLACLFKLRGINLTASAACASGSQSIGLGALLIRNGLQDCVVCGGAQEANMYSVAAFDGIQSFSVREDEPAKASRPFDRDRDGLVPGGGAATVILESYEHAVRRGAPILAEVVSWGFSSNGDHISTPNVAGPARSLELCLQNGGVDPRDIGYINAHGTATDRGDSAESQAMAAVFGNKTPVSTLKSYMGHTLGACGSLEAWMSIMMMNEGWFAPTINLENVAEDCSDLAYIRNQPLELNTNYIMSNNFAFGGINTSLIFGRYKE